MCCVRYATWLLDSLFVVAFFSIVCRVAMENIREAMIIYDPLNQWLFLVPVKGGRWHIILQLAVYTTYILPSGGLYATYHLLREPETTETTID